MKAVLLNIALVVVWFAAGWVWAASGWVWRGRRWRCDRDHSTTEPQPQPLFEESLWVGNTELKVAMVAWRKWVTDDPTGLDAHWSVCFDPPRPHTGWEPLYTLAVDV